MLCRFFAGALASGGHDAVVTWFALRCESNYTEDLNVFCNVQKFPYNGRFKSIYFVTFCKTLIAKGKHQQMKAASCRSHNQ